MAHIRLLTAADIPAGQRLREQAGWNQTAHDWRRLLAWDPTGCWVAEQDGQVVGTTTVTSYGRRIAWVGMVLVDESHRRQGIGQALLQHALAYLDARGVQTVALDSTPAGQPLYHRLGFQDQFELARWRGPFPLVDALGRSPNWLERPPGQSGQSLEARQPAGRLRLLTVADLPAVAAYDAHAFGTDRAHILVALQAGHPAGAYLAERAGRVAGYALSRPGARAWHLGPLAADDPETAAALARATLTASAVAAPPAAASPGVTAAPDLVMDAVMPNAAAVQLAEALGLTLVRPFIRMTRGGPPPAVAPTRLYTSAGPELG